MPYRLSFEDDLLCLEFSGAVSEGDFKAFSAEMLALEATRPVLSSRVTDLTTATAMNLRYADVARLAEIRKAQKFPNTFKSAIIAPQPVHYGFARMFQTLNDHPQITIRIFADRAAALAWIKEEEVATS